MTMRIKAVYEGGVLKPREPLALPEHTEVLLSVSPVVCPAGDEDDPTGWIAMRRIIGMWKDAPVGEPIAREHDRYIYGWRRDEPSRSEG
jgi:hypothetical protein